MSDKPFNPPWRFDPHLNPKEIFWGGAYVLLQIFAAPGTHTVNIANLRKGSKVVFQRSEETGEGYEGIFLISINNVPPRDDLIKPGENTQVFDVVLNGTEPAPEEFLEQVCFAYQLDVTYTFRSQLMIMDTWQFTAWWLVRTTVERTPNPTVVGVVEFYLGGGNVSGIGIIPYVGFNPDDYPKPADVHITSPETHWLFDQSLTSVYGVVHGGRYFDTRFPCEQPPPGQPKLFQFNAYLFPRTKIVVDAANKWWPLKKLGVPNWKWDDSLVWSIQSEKSLDKGTYPVNMQIRKFRNFDLPTDHDGDEPLPKKPTDADSDPEAMEAWKKQTKKVEDDNQKRFDGRHKMLQLWSEGFEYRVEQFRYPTVPPKKPPPGEKQPANPNPVPPVPNVLSYDVEWLKGLNGPPPVLLTQNEDS